VDRIANDEVVLVVNTPLGAIAHTEDTEIRRAAVKHGVPCITTLSGADAAVEAMEALATGRWEVESLQEITGKAVAIAADG
jgi:carbamoyl-phosphate synthase large subunit